MHESQGQGRSPNQPGADFSSPETGSSSSGPAPQVVKKQGIGTGAIGGLTAAGAQPSRVAALRTPGPRKDVQRYVIPADDSSDSYDESADREGPAGIHPARWEQAVAANVSSIGYDEVEETEGDGDAADIPRAPALTSGPSASSNQPNAEPSDPGASGDVAAMPSTPPGPPDEMNRRHIELEFERAVAANASSIGYDEFDSPTGEGKAVSSPGFVLGSVPRFPLVKTLKLALPEPLLFPNPLPPFMAAWNNSHI